jgi:hypothetical protein
MKQTSERIIRGFGILCGAGALVALLAYYPDVADDFDVWWHLKYGEHFVRNLTWKIDHSVFSWTPASPCWGYVSWIGSSLLYLVHRIGGYPALVALQWLIFFGVAGLFYWFIGLCRTEWNAVHLAGLLLAGIAVNPIAVYLKPELFTLVFFAAVVFIYFAAKVNRRNYFWLYPPLFLAWVNTHGGFINGMVFATLALGAEVFTFSLKHPGRMPKPLLWNFVAGVGLSCVAVMINPHGFLYLANIFQSAAQGESHVRSIMAYFPLWDYLFPAGFHFRKINAAWAMLLMAVVLFGLAGGLWMQKKKSDPALLLVNALFFVFGFSIFRASIYFCILWLFSCQYLLRIGQWRLDWRSAVPALLFSLAAAGMIVCETVVYNIYDSRFGARITNFIPAAEVGFIVQNKLPGPIFNDYLSGGYLVWALPPDYKVFIDPRYGPYASTGVWDDYLGILASGNLRMLDSKYRCNTALIMSGNHRLVDLFLNSPDWAFVYFDRAAAVFVRKSWLGLRTLPGGMRAEKFSAVGNPQILFTAFYLYCNFNLADAKNIYSIYRNNVRPWYAGRPYHLERMRQVLDALSSRK